jgi:hypothetical protein
MREGGDLNAVARDFDMTRETLGAILEMSIREGYLKKVDVRFCGACPLGGMCKVEPSECDKTRIYIVTPKGEEYAG